MSAIRRDAGFHRIKMAAKDLVSRAGGIERAAGLTGYSKTQVHRWTVAEPPDLMPLAAVMALEAEVQAPVVSRALAQMAEQAGGSAPPLFHAFADVERASAGLTTEMAEALRDGCISAREQSELAARAGCVDAANAAFRDAVAALKRVAQKLDGAA